MKNPDNDWGKHCLGTTHFPKELMMMDKWIEIGCSPEETFCVRDIRKSMTKEWNGEVRQDSRLKEQAKEREVVGWGPP